MVIFNSCSLITGKLTSWNGKDSLKEKEYLENGVKQKPGPQRKMRLLDAFLLVFMRLHLRLLEQDLAQRFCVSVSTISQVLITCACCKSEAFNCVAKQRSHCNQHP